ncbi:MAG: flagellar filament capping protein FliD [Spirochaetia bacterium]
MSDAIGYLGGGKYKPYIDQLVKIAEDKRKPMETRLERSEIQKDVLVENRRDIGVLQSTIRRLFGLESVFNQSDAISSNPNSVTAEVKRGAKPTELSLDVRQIAASDRFYSKELEIDYQISAGTYDFFVGETKIPVNFEGGTLSAFSQAISKASPENIKSSIIKSSSDKETLLLESLKLGSENRLNFEGLAKKMAFDLGLVTDEVAFNYVVKNDNAGLRAQTSLDPKMPLRLNPGRYLDIGLESGAPLKIQKGAFLSLEYKKNETQGASVTYTPSATGISKQQALREGSLIPDLDAGLTHLPRILDQPNVYLVIDGVLTPVATLDLQETYSPIKIGLDEYSGDVEGIVFRNESGLENIEVQNLEFFTPSELDFIPINAASRAQDAEFTLDGVEVKRPNNKIEDLTPEVNLFLHGKSQGPMTITVKPDFESAEEAIRNFIIAYNFYASKINVVTTHKENVAVLEEINFETEREKEAAEKRLGIYQGDSQLNQLKGRMFTLMTAPYITGAEREKRMVFGDMGISSNNQGGQGGLGNLRGYFEIDDKKLRAKLESDWNDVKAFFASHTGATIIADDGLAVKMGDYLKSFGGNDGLMSSRIGILDRRIGTQEKEIDDFNEKLADQKKKWETDFAKVLSAESELERLKKQMDGIFSAGGK